MRYWAQGTGNDRSNAPCIANIGLAATNTATMRSADARPRKAGASQIGQESQARQRITTTAGEMRMRTRNAASDEKPSAYHGRLGRVTGRMPVVPVVIAYSPAAWPVR